MDNSPLRAEDKEALPSMSTQANDLIDTAFPTGSDDGG